MTQGRDKGKKSQWGSNEGGDMLSCSPFHGRTLLCFLNNNDSYLLAAREGRQRERENAVERKEKIEQK